MRIRWASLCVLLACKPEPESFVFPSPDASPSWWAEGPSVSFSGDALWEQCVFLNGDEEADLGHHNLVLPYRGQMVMPWAKESGEGGVSLFDVSDPCGPVKMGETLSSSMRETHAMGFVHLREGEANAGDWAVTTSMDGVEFWDLSDSANPEVVSVLGLPGVLYPDAYARVVLSLSWQYPWLYVGAADNGIYVVDATNPRQPEVVSHFTLDVPLRVGGVFARGDRLFVSAAEGREALFLDLQDPAEPQLVPGARFTVLNGNGIPREFYHANWVGDLALFTIKEDGGGLVVYDVANEQNPQHLGGLSTEYGNGGYVFYDEGLAFLGDSLEGMIIDLEEVTEPVISGSAVLFGDVDTFTPYGNIAVLSVDEEGVKGEASSVLAWTEEPDTTAPELMSTRPLDGAVDVAPSTCIGMSFNEFIEPSSVFSGSIRLVVDDEERGVDAWGSAQENTAFLCPKAPLEADTRYRVEIQASGVMDINANRFETTQSFSFTTQGAWD